MHLVGFSAVAHVRAVRLLCEAKLLCESTAWSCSPLEVGMAAVLVALFAAGGDGVLVRRARVGAARRLRHIGLGAVSWDADCPRSACGVRQAGGPRAATTAMAAPSCASSPQTSSRRGHWLRGVPHWMPCSCRCRLWSPVSVRSVGGRYLARGCGHADSAGCQGHAVKGELRGAPGGSRRRRADA